MKIILNVFFISIFFIVSPEAMGAIYGPERGKCYEPDNSKEIGPHSDLKKEIDQLTVGRALILSPGNYFIKNDIVIPTGTSIIAKRINGRCSSEVMIETTGTIILSNNTKLNGLNIKRETPCGKDCHGASVIKIKNVKGIRIVNNKILGAAGDKVFIGSNAEDITIRGNEFIGGDRWMIGVRGNPTKNVLIENNRFENCGNDCIQAENQINLYIIGNEFYGGKNTIQVLDIKVAKGDSVIKNNIIDCRNIKSSGCVLYHANDYEFPKDAKAEFSKNRLIGCNSRFIIIGGDKKYKYRNLVVRDNIFDSLGNQCEIQLYKCINCYVHNNEIIGGKLKINKETEKGIIQLNKFLNTKFTNNGGDIKCIENTAKNTSGKICNKEDSVIVSVPEVIINRPPSSKHADNSEEDDG